MEKNAQIGVMLIGLLGGIAVGVQGPMSGAISRRLGPISASLIIHVGGTIVSTLLLILGDGEKIEEWRHLSAPLLLAGVIGPLLYWTLSYTLPRLGAGGSVVLMVAGQFIVVLLIDHWGWFGVPQHSMNPSRAMGSVFLLIAIYLLTR